MAFVDERFILNPLTKKQLKNMKPDFGFDGVGAIVYYRCVSVGTKVLTADLRWVNVESLEIGDELIGVDEYAQDGTRRFRRSIVEDTGIRTDDCLTVETDKGAITVNYEHPFLASIDNRRHWEWVKAKDLTDRHLIRYTGDVWESENGDSWLAGMYDGEGSVSNARVHLAQQVQSIAYPRISAELSKRGIPFTVHVEKTQHRNHLGCVNVNGTENSMRVLGTVRPERLLNNWQKRLDAGKVGLPRDGVARVQNVVDAGRKEIVNLQTSTRTFISNGFVSHNTYSRLKPDGSQEHWHDTIIRVVEGIMSIRKDWYAKNNIRWDETYWQQTAHRMALAMFDMRMLPPGRGLTK